MVEPGSKGQEARPRINAMVRSVFENALADAGLEAGDVDGIIAVPALADLRFLEAHLLATVLGLFDKGHPLCRTIDTCGASPVTGLLEADRMIRDGRRVVAVLGGDCVGSLSGANFLEVADRTAQGLGDDLASPAIVRGYERFTEYELGRGLVNRDHLRMAVALESFHASKHPHSVLRRKRTDPYSLEELRQAAPVTPHISINECAWRADGAACVILTAPDHAPKDAVRLAGGAEASAALAPPAVIDEQAFVTGSAMRAAYAHAGLAPSDIDFFALYDCFPVCFVRAIMASGMASGRCDRPESVGPWIEAQYDAMLNGRTDDDSFFPCNTHGGLLCYGAPFAVPAFYNVVEAVHQLRGQALGRQLSRCNRALVYGNGGVLSSAAVAILERPER